jgi:hypothetical protein
MALLSTPTHESTPSHPQIFPHRATIRTYCAETSRLSAALWVRSINTVTARNLGKPAASRRQAMKPISAYNSVHRQH